MSTVTVMSVDPGITTGLCYVGLHDRHLTGYALTQKKMSVVEYWYWLRGHNPDLIVIEDFEYRNRSRAGLVLFSVELLGVTDLWADLHTSDEHPVRVYRQKASQGKGYFDDTKLKAANLYDPKYRHGRDALRHMLYWLAFKQGSQLWDTCCDELSYLRRFQPSRSGVDAPRID